ncbi:MAG: amidohydrolase family protein [Pseudomonadota bacterium]
MIDAHAHVWRAGSLQIQWLDTPPVAGDPRWAPLRATFSPEMLRDLLAAEGLEAAVLVEAADALEETEALLAITRAHDWALGAVGWLPLAEPAAFAAGLARYGDNPGLVGLRHMIHGEADPNWVLQTSVVDSLRQLGAAGLAFDYVGVSLDHLDSLARLANACPDTTIVLDHLNSPPIAEGPFQPWAARLSAAAERPNVVAKVSGLEICSTWRAWRAADWRPYLDLALRAFGAERLMLGSNWPVSTLSASYAKTWAAHRAWLATLSESEQAAVATGTARRVYERGA